MTAHRSSNLRVRPAAAARRSGNAHVRPAAAAKATADNGKARASKVVQVARPSTEFKRDRTYYYKQWRTQQKGENPKPVKAFYMFASDWTSQNAGCMPQHQSKVMQTVANAWRNLSEEERNKWKNAEVEALRVWQTQQHTVQAPSDPTAGTAANGQTLAGTVSPTDSMALQIMVGPYWLETIKEKLMGKGSFGAVYQGMHKDTHQIVAIKVFHDQDNCKTITREIEVYECLAKANRHVPFAHMLWSNRDHSGMKAMVLDVYDDDLHHWLRKNAADQSLLTSMGRQILLALNYLHTEAKYVHLDVKPANILWRRVDNKIALVDFGMAEPISSSKPLHSLYCTANYRPPELWPSAFGGKTPGKLLQPCVDTWSLGCSWWQMTTNEILFVGQREKEIECQIMHFGSSSSHKEWEARLSKAGHWSDFIRVCLKPNPVARPQDLLSLLKFMSPSPVACPSMA
jgi:hypothetical protein